MTFETKPLPDTETRATPQDVKTLKARMAVHHLIQVSEITGDIAKAVNMGKTNLEKLTHTPYWEDALDFWGISGKQRYKLPARNEAEREKLKTQRRSLEAAEHLWTEMIHEGIDLFPSEDYYREHHYLRHEDDDHFQITVEALQTHRKPRFNIWVNDAVAAVFAIGMLI